jgi:hypothetical protein
MPTLATAPQSTLATSTGRQTHQTFDIHGLVGIDVDPGTPGEAQLLDMLAPFIAESKAEVRIRVTGGSSELDAPSHAEHAYRYTADTVSVPRDRVTVSKTAEGFTIAGSGELLTAVIPLLDRLCVQQDTAMVHAAMVNYRGAGVLMPAWGGVGKTSTVAKLLAIDGVGFMADDWAFLRGDGMLLGYAKPMFIKPHHRAIYPRLFAGTRKPLAPSRFTKPLEQLATAVHPVIVRYPRVAAFTRRWSPEHRMVHPAEVFGADKIADQAPTQVAIFLERFDGQDASFEPRSPEWMTGRIVGNFHTELPTVSRRLIEALGATGLVPLEEYFAEKSTVVLGALRDIPCHVLKLPVSWSADRASDFVTATVRSVVNG